MSECRLHWCITSAVQFCAGSLADDWEKIAAEEPSPSQYGTMNYFEDFCESNAMYLAAKGGECEQSFVAAYPKRYERLEMYHKEGK